MRVVVALGGNALLKRGEPMTTDVQRRNVRRAAPALAAIAADHELVLSHGNGPQVGLLALQAAAYTEVEPYTLDVLGAQTAGDDRLRPRAGAGQRDARATDRFATILTMVEVDPADPAFENPTKFVGPVYTEEQADASLPRRRAGPFKQDGDVVASRGAVAASPSASSRSDAIRGADRPRRRRHLHRRRRHPDHGHGHRRQGDPDRGRGRHRQGPRQRAARPGGRRRPVRDGHRRRRCLHRLGDPEPAATGAGSPPTSCAAWQFPAGSMGPKVEAAAGFVEATGRRAAIGSLGDIEQIVDGTAGTQVVAG